MKRATIDPLALARMNIKALQPYSSARDEFTGDEGIFLDANENPYGEINRYPDPHQRLLKSTLSAIKEIPVENMLIGNGSDEVIDLIFRVFCEPQQDKVIICPPTYGMYEVSAHINNVGIISVPLTADFALNIDAILSHRAKCLFVCSPNNPTGNLLQGIERLLREFKGMVVIDEAYIDFSAANSFIKLLPQYPNLIVMQTFSKAWGLAGARVGIAYAAAEVIALMNKTKPPYNVSTLNQKAALEALSDLEGFRQKRDVIVSERGAIEKALRELPIVRKIYPSEANFLLVEVTDANTIYQYLVAQKVIVRNRNTVVRNCLRITVGTPQENKILLNALKNYASQYSSISQ